MLVLPRHDVWQLGFRGRSLASPSVTAGLSWYELFLHARREQMIPVYSSESPEQCLLIATVRCDDAPIAFPCVSVSDGTIY